MAENDKRIESLEDEVKVLKGEVKRTLVDLRALLMREDSPLNEGGMARRAAAAAKPPAPEPPVQKEVVREAVQQAVAAAPPAAPEPRPAPPPVAATPPPRSEPAPAATPPPPPPPIARPAFVATVGPGPGPGAMAAGPGRGPGPGPAQFITNPGPWPAPPPYYPPAPPGPPPQDQHLAEQERHLAQQERMLAQQEREMAHQERRKARDEEEDRPRKRSKREDQDRDDGRHEEPDVPVMPVRPSLALPWSPGAEMRPSDTLPPRAKVDLSGERKEEELDQPRRRQEEDRAPVRASSARNSQYMDRDEEEDSPQRPARSSAGSRVFEEYWELLDEATAQSPAGDATGSPVDVNVIASLVHWVATAKQQLGDEKLKELMELYLQSGHSRPGLQDLLMHLHSIVAPAPEGAAQSKLEWVDLMFQLHGILTGGLPIGRLPPVALASKPAVTAPAPAVTTPAPAAAAPAPSPGAKNRATPPPVVAVE